MKKSDLTDIQPATPNGFLFSFRSSSRKPVYHIFTQRGALNLRAGDKIIFFITACGRTMGGSEINFHNVPVGLVCPYCAKHVDIYNLLSVLRANEKVAAS